jgi:hypothetical protein
VVAQVAYVLLHYMIRSLDKQNFIPFNHRPCIEWVKKFRSFDSPSIHLECDSCIIREQIGKK